jgi:sortase A
MTLLDDPPAGHPVPSPDPWPAPAPAPTALPAGPPSSPGGVRVLLLVWVAALVLGQALVVLGLGPMFQDRTQRSLMRSYRTDIEHAVNAGGGFAVGDGNPGAPAPGSVVGILEIGHVSLQQAVVEGIGTEQTREGPGHVPGTAGLGEPGNAVVVARRAGFGGPFRDLGGLKKGNPIVVTTTSGQSVYKVASVKEVRLATPNADGDLPDGAVSVTDVYGRSDDDRLTLVTSASVVPWNSERARVVVATLATEPFRPTLQGTRVADATGGHPDSGAKAAVVLAVLVYGLALGLAVLLYKRLPGRVAYLLSVAPIVALTIITAETLSRLLPAWL